MSNNYWARRLQKRQDALFSLSYEEARGRYVKAYTDAIKATQRDIEALYDTLLKEAADGKIKMNDVYKYNRFFELQSKLNQRLAALGHTEIKIMDQKLLNLYGKTSKLVAEEANGIGVKLLLEDPYGGKAAVDSIWCADGQHWSNRIWKQKGLLQTRLEKGIFDCIARGVGKDEFVKQLNKDFNVGFHNTDRIARTELTYIQNRAAADRYKANGITHYKYLSAIDERTSEICKELNGKVFSFSEAVVGVNMPPCHANCRSTIIPVIEGVD